MTVSGKAASTINGCVDRAGQPGSVCPTRYHQLCTKVSFVAVAACCDTDANPLGSASTCGSVRSAARPAAPAATRHLYRGGTARTAGGTAMTAHCFVASASPSSTAVATTRLRIAATTASTLSAAQRTSSGWPRSTALVAAGAATASSTTTIDAAAPRLEAGANVRSRTTP